MTTREHAPGAIPAEIYADHAATTPPRPEAVAAMAPWLGEAFGNASSVHGRGERARDAVERARVQVADLIGALPEEIVFTASGSEANNLALKGSLAASGAAALTEAAVGPGAGAARRRLVISAIEHPSVLETARHLESRGHPLTVVPVTPDGVIDLARLEEALGSDVALVSVQWVNNEIGTIQPVEEIARLAHACGARYHVDAVQAAGKLPIDVGAVACDLLSFAGHKLHGPLGAAAIYLRRRTRLVPLIHGGHQERSRRAGTENVPALVGFGVAAQLAAERLAGGEATRIAALGQLLESGLLARLPGARIHGASAHRAPGIVNVCLGGVDGEAVLHELDHAGIVVSTGSACSAASPGPSHVILALGLGPEDAHGSVRFSLGASNDEAQVERVLDVVPEVVAKLRALAGTQAEHGRAAS